MLGDRLLDVLDLPAAKLGVVERAEERVPFLDASESEPGGVEATTAGTRQHRADHDAVLSKRFAHLAGLAAPAVVQVALRRTVVELRIGRIEPAGREAVAQHHDDARRPQRLPDGIGARLRPPGGRNGPGAQYRD